MENNHGYTMDKFQSFLNKVWTEDNALLIESIQSAYGVIFEARVLPEIKEHDGEGPLGFHEYSVNDSGRSLLYSVGSVDKVGNPIIMDIQFNKLPPAIGGELGQLTMINFTERESGFNATNTGSMDGFNSVFSVIKMVSPENIYFKATDDDPKKASQKSRLYAGFLKNLGYTKVPTENLTPQLQKSGGEVYSK